MIKYFLALLFLPFFLGSAVIDFPFGTKIYFNAPINGNQDIYYLTENRLVRVTDHPAEDEYPSLDSKAERMVFQSRRTGSYNIFLLDLKTKKLRQLTFDERNKYSPSFSPDDRYVLFDLEIKKGAAHVMKLELATGKMVPLFPDPPYSQTIVAYYHPDGNQIFFTAKVFFGWALAHYDEKGKIYKKITNKGNCRSKPSPNGKLVAYVSFEDDGLGDVCLITPDGKNRRNLTSTRDKHYDYYPCFSPDSNWIVFSSSPEDKKKKGYQLHILNIQSKEIRPILKVDANCQFPFWSK